MAAGFPPPQGMPPSPGAGAPPAPPGAGAPPPPGGAGMPPGGGQNPLQKLAGKSGGAMSGSLLQILLTFLAGAGLNPTLEGIGKVLNGFGSMKGKGAAGKAPAAPPAGAGGPPPGAIPPAAALQALAQRGR